MTTLDTGNNIVFQVGDRRSALPEGEYDVVLLKIEKASYGGKRARLDFVFEVRSGEFRGSIVKAFVNSQYEKFSSFTKLYQWWCIAAGREPEEGEDISTQVFFDKVLRVKIETKVSRKTAIAFSNVTQILSVTGEI